MGSAVQQPCILSFETRLADQLAPGIQPPTSAFLELGLQTHHATPSSVTWVLEIGLSSLCLHDKHFTNRAIFPAQSWPFFKTPLRGHLCGVFSPDSSKNYPASLFSYRPCSGWDIREASRFALDHPIQASQCARDACTLIWHLHSVPAGALRLSALPLKDWG